MTQLKFPGGLSEIAGQYDAILCDVWGVIHNGRDAFEEAWERDPYLYQGLNLSFGEPDESDVLLCIGLSDSLKDHPSDYTDTLKQGVDRNIPMICANPDKQVRIGGQLHWCAGALAEIYEDLGGSVIYPGKPHAAIYDLAVSRVGDAAANKSQAEVSDLLADYGEEATYAMTGLRW